MKKSKKKGFLHKTIKVIKNVNTSLVRIPVCRVKYFSWCRKYCFIIMKSKIFLCSKLDRLVLSTGFSELLSWLSPAVSLDPLPLGPWGYAAPGPSLDSLFFYVIGNTHSYHFFPLINPKLITSSSYSPHMRFVSLLPFMWIPRIHMTLNPQIITQICFIHSLPLFSKSPVLTPIRTQEYFWLFLLLSPLAFKSNFMFLLLRKRSVIQLSLSI